MAGLVGQGVVRAGYGWPGGSGAAGGGGGPVADLHVVVPDRAGPADVVEGHQPHALVEAAAVPGVRVNAEDRGALELCRGGRRGRERVRIISTHHRQAKEKEEEEKEKNNKNKK